MLRVGTDQYTTQSIVTRGFRILISKLSEFLARIFIKNHQVIHDSFVRSQYGILEGWLSVGINLILGISKIIVATIIGSISLLADGIHSLTDMLTSFIVISSFYLGRKPSDEEHPFGHGRAEQIAALIMAVLIGVGGIELIKGSFDRVLEPQPVQMSIIAIILLILTVILKEILSRISQYYGRKIQSLALEADSWHHRTDAVSSILVIIAILAAQAGLTAADGVVGILIGLFIIYTGIDIARRTSMKLLGTRPSEGILNKVESLALRSKNALAVHDMICHEYGTQMVISFHLEVPSQLKLSEAHTIADNIENNILKELKIQATVHLDPVLPEVSNRNQIIQIISSFISERDNILDHKALRLIGEESHATLVLDIITDNSPTDHEIEEINRSLKEKLSGHISNIKDVRINYITKLI
jgi:cation diffusion facilitator family transporter